MFPDIYNEAYKHEAPVPSPLNPTTLSCLKAKVPCRWTRSTTQGGSSRKRGVGQISPQEVMRSTKGAAPRGAVGCRGISNKF